MLQLQSSRNKAVQDWKKKETNFLQRNKLALKQSTKQASLKTNVANKQPNVKARKPPTPRPPPTSKTAKGDNSRHHRTSTNEDSVVITKSALDDLLKQLVDAKQAATILSPINSSGIVSAVDVHHNEPSTTTTKDRKEHHQQAKAAKHIDLDHSDIPGLSSLKSPPTAYMNPAIAETAVHASDIDGSKSKRSLDAQHVYFPFGRPGGGAPNKPRHSDFVMENHESHVTGQEMNMQHVERVNQSKTFTSDIYSPQGSTNTSPRKHTDISPTHAKSVYLEQWQIEERESKRRKELEHYEFIRAQIAEKERNKEEIRSKKALEERQEEERLERQRERLQRDYQEEQERVRRKEEEVARRNALLYQKIQEAENVAFEAKQKSKLAPRFNHSHNINIPKIYEEQYSDYESGTDDPESRTNLDQLKVRLSFESALRSPSMCNVIDSTQDQELSTSPKKNAAKLKSKSPQKQNLKLTVSEVRDKKIAQSTHRHHDLSKDKSLTNKQNDTTSKPGAVKKGKLREKQKSLIPISKVQIKKGNYKAEKEKADADIKPSCTIKRQRNEDTHQRRQKISKIMAEKSNTSVDNFATHSCSHIRVDSPPVPALAKKLANSAESSSGQSTDGNVKSPTALSKRTQRKVARRIDYKELPSKPKPNSVDRMQQPHQQQETMNHLHDCLQRSSNSPPVPALAKKLQTHQLHNDSSVEFGGSKRPVLPPITTAQNDVGLNKSELDENTVPSRRPQPVLPPVGETDNVTVEIKSNSPPVPALAKRLNQQQVSNINGHGGAHNSVASQNIERNKFSSSELHSDSRFTYFSEPDTHLTASSNPYYNIHPIQQVVYVPVSPQQFSVMYSQPVTNYENPHQGVTVPPQILSPVPVMVSPPTLSPVHSHHPQSSGLNVAIEKPTINTSQLPPVEHYSVSSNTVQQPNAMIQHGSRTVHNEPPLVVTIQEHQTLSQGYSAPVHSPPPAAFQPTQEKEAVLQHLALMKKRLLAQQQSIKKKHSLFTLPQPDDKQPPSL